jgi:8-oxo-dGTP pyrophosphatase MutT (NUDIX family)
MGTLGVNVAIFRDGQILLTQRDDFHVWCMPGGHVDPGETLPQAAKREVREETGIDVRVSRLVGIYSRPRWGEYHIAVFVADALGGGHAAQHGEVIDMRFFGPDELPGALLIGQRQRIMDAFSGSEVCAASRTTTYRLVP